MLSLPLHSGHRILPLDLSFSKPLIDPTDDRVFIGSANSYMTRLCFSAKCSELIQEVWHTSCQLSSI